jgi:hypothetical protein
MIRQKGWSKMPYIIKWIWRPFSAALIILISILGRAGEYRVPDIPVGEVCQYIVHSEAKEGESASESWISPREETIRVTQVISGFEKGGRSYYKFFRAEYLAGKHINYYSYDFTRSDPYRFVIFEKMMQSPNGRLIKKEITYFDDPGHPFPPDLNHFFSLPMTLRGLDFEGGQTNDLQIWFSSHFTPWKMNVIVEGRERVKVPAGEFTCYKVRVEPNLRAIFRRWYWVARMIRPWIPNFYYWFDVKKPYPMVRFEGRFGPVGFSPVQVHELVSIGEATEEEQEMTRRFSSPPDEMKLYEDFAKNEARD